jgi:WD40 repeat protein
VPEGPAYCAAFSPDGSRIVLGSAHVVPLFNYHGAGVIRIVDATSGRILKHIGDAHKRGVESLAISPRGDTLASAGGDGLVKLWDLRTMTALKELSVTPGVGAKLAFSPGGRFLVVTDYDRTRLLDTLTGEVRDPPGSFRGKASPAFSPDGRYLTAWNIGGMLLYRIEWLEADGAAQ